MKKILLLSFLFSAVQAFSQIKIEKSDMPKVGDTLRYSNTNSRVDISKTGPNQVWNFKDLEPSSQGVYEYKSSLRTPYLLNFGFTALGLKVADTVGAGQLQLKNVYDFFNSSNSKYEAIGTGFQYASLPLPQSGKHSNSDIIYALPLEYNDNDSDTYNIEIPISLAGFPIGKLIRSGERKTVVDGWGKITTPYAKDVECIRVKSIIDGFDSISISTLNVDFGFPSSTIEYKWLSKTERIPMLSVTGTQNGRTFIPSEIRYRDMPRDIAPPGSINVLFEADDTTPVTGQIVQLTNKTEGFIQNYTWTITPETGFKYVTGNTANDENPKVQFSDPGKYTVKLVVGNFFRSDSATQVDYINVSRNAGVGPVPHTEINIYPNPASDVLNVFIPENQGSFKLEVSDVTGRTLLKKHINETEKISLDSWAPGWYNVKLKNNDSQFEQEFIKQ